MKLCPLFAALAICVAPLAAHPSDRYVYPRSESSSDSQYTYDYEPLRLALEATRATHGDYELKASDEPMNQARAAHEIAAGGSVIIFARSTAVEHEQRMLPIRIPLDKGLVGYRLFLIRKDMQPRIDGVKSLEDLRRFSVGSFVTWADTQILRARGFAVVTGDNYEGLFRMLIAKRFDLFSRSIDEAFREYEERKTALPDLAIEEGLVLHFPTTRYFFVQRSAEGQARAARIAQGLETLIRNGALDAHFNRYKAPMIERAKLPSRRIFRIDNPLLPPETPLDRSELWIDLRAPGPSGKRSGRRLDRGRGPRAEPAWPGAEVWPA